MNEFDLIRQYFTEPFANDLDLSGGLDDCAILSLPAESQQVLSIDTMLENVHFYSDMPAEAIGHRALATAVSDLAAMGAQPWWFTLALSLPTIDEPWLKAFSQGLQVLACRLNMPLVGGDTTKGPLAISVQVGGLLPTGTAMCRKGAKEGDYIAVTGSLGNAAGGLSQWHEPSPNGFLREAYCKPLPKIEIGQAIRQIATACIDISDGLLADVGHIAKASAVKMHIDYNALPIDPVLQLHFGETDAKQKALHGGDDYELCFCFKQKDKTLLDKLAIEYHIIGKVCAGKGVQLLNNTNNTVALTDGYNHFNE